MLNKFRVTEFALVASLLTCVGVLGVSGPASATGNYDWVCIGSDGNSWTLKSGEKTSDCKGSYLQKYLDGKFIKAYPMDGRGQPVSGKPKNFQCALWTAKTIIGIMTTDGLFLVISFAASAASDPCRA